MGNGYVYSIFGLILTFSGSGSDVLGCDWCRNFFKNGDGCTFPQSRLAFLAKQCVPSPPNNIVVGFWSLEGIFKTLQQALHFLVVEISRFIG